MPDREVTNCLSRFKIYAAGQKRWVTPAIKRIMKRRSAVEPVIGHIKNEHRMNRNYLAHTQGNATNPIFAAMGYNFRIILKWIRTLYVWIWGIIQNSTSNDLQIMTA